jgi:predicted NBD/HSP70 family sugar kinase
MDGELMKKLALLALLIPSTAQAACVTLDTSGWTQEQKNLITAISYHLIYQAGQNIVPTVNGNEVCFEGSTGNLSAIINETTILAAYAANQQAGEEAAQAEAMEQEAYIQEIGSNDLCEGTLDEMIARAAAYVNAKRVLIDTQKANFDAQVDAVSNFNTAAVKVALKQISANNATAYNQILDVVKTVAEKQAKCGLARARRSEF